MKAVPSLEPNTRPVIRGTQHCPTCGLPPESVVASRIENGISQANLLDAQGHIWNVRWPVAT